jgi:hypothetical protein
VVDDWEIDFWIASHSWSRLRLDSQLSSSADKKQRRMWFALTNASSNVHRDVIRAWATREGEPRLAISQEKLQVVVRLSSLISPCHPVEVLVHGSCRYSRTSIHPPSEERQQASGQGDTQENLVSL